MPLWVVCGVNVSSCLGLCCSLMQHIYSPYLISYNFAIHFIFTSTFLCECACMCSCVCVCVCAVPACVCAQWLCHSAKRWTRCWQATQSVDSPRGHAALEAENGACHPNHQPPLPLPSPPPPPSPSANRPTPRSPLPGPQRLGCGLWMSATSWLSAQGLAGDWPVVEVQYQALSVSSSFHFLPPLSAAWAAVSGANIL